ncbi:MAG: hypothetical protein ACLP1X_35770 [Polyangiaceae bacterium]
MARRFVGRFQQTGTLQQGVFHGGPVARSGTLQTPPERRKDHSGDKRHSRRKGHEERTERDKLRDGPRTPEQTLSKTGLELANAFGEGGNGSCRWSYMRTLIFVSRMAHSVCSQERVEQLEPEARSDLGRGPGLNEGCVSARRSLDGNDSETHEREEQRLVCKRSRTGPEVVRFGTLEPPPLSQRNGQGASDQRHKRVAKGVQ